MLFFFLCFWDFSWWWWCFSTHFHRPGYTPSLSEINLSIPRCFLLQHNEIGIKAAADETCCDSPRDNQIDQPCLIICDLFYWMCLKCFVLLHQQLEAELHESWEQLSSLQSHCIALEDQLSFKEKEAAAKDGQLRQLLYGENVTL